MDEQTKKLLNEYLVKLLGAIEKGTDFAAEQIPLVIQEKLTFSFYEHLFYAFVWGLPVLTIVGICLWLSRYFYKDNDSDWPGPLVGGFVVLCCGLIPVGYNVVAMLKISIAPRLYILEWLQGAL